MRFLELQLAISAHYIFFFAPWASVMCDLAQGAAQKNHWKRECMLQWAIFGYSGVNVNNKWQLPVITAGITTFLFGGHMAYQVFPYLASLGGSVGCASDWWSGWLVSVECKPWTGMHPPTPLPSYFFVWGVF